MLLQDFEFPVQHVRSLEAAKQTEKVTTLLRSLKEARSRDKSLPPGGETQKQI